MNTNDESMRQEDGRRSAFEARSKELFDASVGELEGNIRSRLTRARHAAVAELDQRSPWSRLMRREWLPAFGLAGAALLAVMIFLGTMGKEGPLPAATVAADDMTMLLNGDNLEFFEEMEFYAWLDSEGLNGDAEALEGERAPQAERVRS